MKEESGMKYYEAPDEPFYKKIPVVAVVILILLIGAWVFRWDHKHTESYNDEYTKAKIEHKVDRWTGHHWYEIYGGLQTNNSWTFYSGAEVAFLRNGLVADGEQAYRMQNIRTGATVVWFILFFGTLGFVVLRVVRD